jgi:hypothetical protein
MNLAAIVKVTDFDLSWPPSTRKSGCERDGALAEIRRPFLIGDPDLRRRLLA